MSTECRIDTIKIERRPNTRIVIDDNVKPGRCYCIEIVKPVTGQTARCTAPILNLIALRQLLCAFRLSILLQSRSEEAPDSKHDDGPHDRTDKACPFAGAIPAKSLSEVRRYKRPGNPERGRKNKSGWLVR